MERSGFGKTSPSLARRGGDARRRRRRRQPFRRERLRRASTTLRAVTTGRSRARSQPTIHMPTSLPISHRSRGARVTCTLVFSIIVRRAYRILARGVSLLSPIHRRMSENRSRSIIISYYTHPHSAPTPSDAARLSERSFIPSRAHVIHTTKNPRRVRRRRVVRSIDSTRLGSLHPHSDLFARARLPPARVLGVVNRPKIAPRADVPVASVAPRVIGDDDSPPLFARLAPR